MLIKQAGAEEETVLTYSGIAPQLVWSNSVESVVFRILFHWQWRVKVVNSVCSYIIMCYS